MIAQLSATSQLATTKMAGIALRQRIGADLRGRLIDCFGVFDLPAQRLEVLFGEHVTVDLDALAHDEGAPFEVKTPLRATLKAETVPLFGPPCAFDT